MGVRLRRCSKISSMVTARGVSAMPVWSFRLTVWSVKATVN
jgi:hypothetical protein